MKAFLKFVSSVAVTYAALFFVQTTLARMQGDDNSRNSGFLIRSKELNRRTSALRQKAPSGSVLATYLHCGLQAESAGDFPSKIHRMNNSTHEWPAVNEVSLLERTVCFDEHELRFLLSRLDSKKHYVGGVTWWNYDDPVKRLSSITALSSDGKKSLPVLREVALPNYSVDHKLPAEQTFFIDPSLYQEDGKMEIRISKLQGQHAVVSDVWLWAF